MEFLGLAAVAYVLTRQDAETYGEESFDAGDNWLDLNWKTKTTNVPVFDQSVGALHVSKPVTLEQYYKYTGYMLEQNLPLNTVTGFRESGARGGNKFLTN